MNFTTFLWVLTKQFIDVQLKKLVFLFKWSIKLFKSTNQVSWSLNCQACVFDRLSLFVLVRKLSQKRTK